MKNIKALLGLWVLDVRILIKDINLFRLRLIVSYKAFKLDNAKLRLNHKENQ